MLDAATAQPVTCTTPGCVISASACDADGRCQVCALAHFRAVTIPARVTAAVSQYEALAGTPGAGTAAEWRALAAEFDFLATQFPKRSPDRALHTEHAAFAWGRADRMMAPVAGPVRPFRKRLADVERMTAPQLCSALRSSLKVAS